MIRASCASSLSFQASRLVVLMLVGAVCLAGCFPNAKKAWSVDGEYKSDGHGSFLVNGSSVTYSFGGESIEFVVSGQQPLQSGPSVMLNIKVADLKKSAAMQRQIDQLAAHNAALYLGDTFSLPVRVFGGVIFVEGRTFRKDGPLLARTYVNEKWGRMTFAGEGDEFSYEVDGLAFEGWFLVEDASQGILRSSRDLAKEKYFEALGCPDSNVYAERKTFTVSDEEVRTRTGIVFKRVK